MKEGNSEKEEGALICINHFAVHEQLSKIIMASRVGR